MEETTIQAPAQAPASAPAPTVEYLPPDTADSKPDYEVHPVAKLIPAMSEAEYVALCNDIARNGQLEPVTLWEDSAGKRWLIDGRHRREACNGLMIPTAYVEVHMPEERLVDYAVGKNVNRRSLTDSQRAMVAGKVFEEDGLPRGRPSGAQDATVSQEDAAAMMSISLSSVKRAVRVLREGSDTLVDAVTKGLASLADAYSICTEPHDIQNLAVAVLNQNPDKKLKAIVEDMRVQEKAAPNAPSDPSDESEEQVEHEVNLPEKSPEYSKVFDVLVDSLSKLQVAAATSRESFYETLEKYIDKLQDLLEEHKNARA